MRFSLVILLATFALVHANPRLLRADERPAFQKSLDRLADTYEIKIDLAPKFPVATTHGKIVGATAAASSLRNYADLFQREFRLYPKSLVKNAKLKRVVLCRNLSFAGQRRNAIPDFEHDTLYLDVSRGAYSKPYLRAVIHHEFFHLVDYRDDGRIYRDASWTALNREGFKYGRGGRNAQNVPTTSSFTNAYPGFLNHYSTTGVEEDKAELFAHLIVNPIYVQRRVKEDAVLKRKVAKLQSLLKAFCPEMNDAFWVRVSRPRR